MGNQISPLGWVLIILLVLLIVSLYLSLFTKLKDKKEKHGWISSMQNAGKTIKDPFHNENLKIEELAKSVQKLKKNQEIPQENNIGEVGAGESS